MGSGYSKMKKQAKEMQKQLAAMEEKKAEQRVSAFSEGNLVEVVLNGKGELITIHIKPDCVDPDDIDGLQDLIISAHSKAHEKLDDTPNDPMSAFSAFM